MKKALSVFLMLAMVLSAFAQEVTEPAPVAETPASTEPVADVKVAEFKGDASVKWGIDFDTFGTGFKNDISTSLKLNLMNGGSRSTTGDGVWGELVIEVKDPWQFEAGKTVNGVLFPVVKIKKAQINFGPAYLGILAGDTTVGEVKLTTAVKSEKTVVPNKGKDRTQGIVLGFNHQYVDVAVDVRNEGQYNDQYAFAGEVTVKPIDGLKIMGGTAYDIATETLAYAGSLSYKLPLGNFYLLPQVAYSGDKKGEVTSGKLAGGLHFGWGETKDANAGVYYLKDDNAKKVTPGVSVVAETGFAEEDIELHMAFFSGEIVPNLTAAVTTDLKIKSELGADVKAGVKYAIPVAELTITPAAGVHYANKNYSGTDTVEASAGVELAGLVDNTTFSLEYVSGNYFEPKYGTLNVGAKISF